MVSSLLRSAASQFARRTAPSISFSPSRSISLSRSRSISQPNHLPIRSFSPKRHGLTTGTGTGTVTSTSRASSTAVPMAEPTSEQITPESLTSKLQQSLQTTHVSIQDMSGGCGQAFTAVIVSPDFEKKTLLARHRLVNGALKDEIAAIHAWTPKCLTPEQWAKEKERED